MTSIHPVASPDSGSRTSGSQTLARGLTVLKSVAVSADGLAVSEVASRAGVHRTVAYRLLNTLADAGFVRRGDDGRYRGAAGLATLSPAAHQALLAAARPVLRDAVEELGAAVALVVRDGQDAVALAVLSPVTGGFHITFTEGSRHPLDRGAAGLATLASGPARPGESALVGRTRQDGYALTFGEVEPGMYGLAVPLDRAAVGVEGCLNLISVREERARQAAGPLGAAAQKIAGSLRTI